MNFSEAFEKMLDGEVVSRCLWDGTGEYTAIMPGMDFIWKVIHAPKAQAGSWVPSVGDLKADDWKLVDRKYEDKSENDDSKEEKDLAA